MKDYLMLSFHFLDYEWPFRINWLCDSSSLGFVLLFHQLGHCMYSRI